MSYDRTAQLQQDLSIRKNAMLIGLAVLGICLAAIGSWLLLNAEPRPAATSELIETAE